MAFKDLIKYGAYGIVISLIIGLILAILFSYISMIMESLRENNKITWNLLFSPFFMGLFLMPIIIQLIVLGFIWGVIYYIVSVVILKNKRVSWLVIGLLLSLSYLAHNYFNLFKDDESIFNVISSLIYIISIPRTIFFNLLFIFLFGAIIGYIIDKRQNKPMCF